MITLDANGLSVPTRAELRDELVARLRGRFGVNLDVDPTSTIMGQLVEEMTELRALDHQALLACYCSFDLNGAGEEHFTLARAPAAARQRFVLAPQGERCLVDLDNPCERPAIRSSHGAAQLGGEQPRRFIRAERELLLQLQRGNSVGMS